MSVLEPLNFRESLLRQHVVLSHVSWEDYEHCLDVLDGNRTKVIYFKGEMEIMPPPISFEHERRKTNLRRLLECLLKTRRTEYECRGSATFKETGKAGLEPDECYYIGKSAQAVVDVDRFDSQKDPVPDLVLEVEISSWIIERLDVYSALGVPEIWRDQGNGVTVLVLENGTYVEAAGSPLFPFLPIAEFNRFVDRMARGGGLRVEGEFEEWVKGL